MFKLFLVGLGGFLGSILRYSITSQIFVFCAKEFLTQIN